MTCLSTQGWPPLRDRVRRQIEDAARGEHGCLYDEGFTSKVTPAALSRNVDQAPAASAEPGQLLRVALQLSHGGFFNEAVHPGLAEGPAQQGLLPAYPQLRPWTPLWPPGFLPVVWWPASAVVQDRRAAC